MKHKKRDPTSPCVFSHQSNKSCGRGSILPFRPRRLLSSIFSLLFFFFASGGFGKITSPLTKLLPTQVCRARGPLTQTTNRPPYLESPPSRATDLNDISDTPPSSWGSLSRLFRFILFP
ncbi:hypothetical protein BDV41DRAFT_279450 [Aspergillus transmontanensis]|uniref:Uncharacterized protein n=1 Tax=Aspergillus transmontanensis TaxID=1034304 RepID=A0A5N6VX66_9EURO|nr:hypothetical protein BDV41DRAFT_279450 [Aspergillus transmontanensis]